VLFAVCVSIVVEVSAGVKVSEGLDAESVGGMELGLQEVAAGITHLPHLQKVGCWQ